MVVSAGLCATWSTRVRCRASNSAKDADTHLIIPTGVEEILPTLLEAHDGQIRPFGSTSLGGDDAFTLRTQR